MYVITNIKNDYIIILKIVLFYYLCIIAILRIQNNLFLVFQENSLR